MPRRKKQTELEKAKKAFHKKLISAPHDAFARFCLGFRPMARAFFRFALTGEFEQKIDLDRLDRMNASQINSKLNENISDLLFMAPLNDESAIICLLVEHKSNRAEYIPLVFQMRKQEIYVMEYLYHEHPKKLFPKVVMVGLYHGEKAYSGPVSVAEKMVVPPEEAPMRWQEKLNIVDMSKYSDDDLLAQGMLGIFLLVLKHIYDEDINVFAEKLFPKLAELNNAVEHYIFLEAILKYLVAGSKQANVSRLEQNAVKLLGSELGGAVMTTAEMLMKEGEKRGERNKGIKTALIMIGKGIDTKVIAECTELNEKEIEDLKRNGRFSKS